MNMEDHSRIEALLNHLQALHKVERDPDAEQLIESACQRHPDTPYLVIERCLTLHQALLDCCAQMERLDAENRALRKRGTPLRPCTPAREDSPYRAQEGTPGTPLPAVPSAVRFCFIHRTGQNPSADRSEPTWNLRNSRVNLSHPAGRPARTGFGTLTTLDDDISDEHWF